MRTAPAVQPTITAKEISEFRLALLKKHQCSATLANIDAPPAADAAPATRSTDHWAQAGSISGSHGMVITVDLDSMISAGPGKMRTWIKYRYSGVGPKNVKESLVYEQLDCVRNYHSTISLYSYSPSGQIVLTGSGKPEDEEPIIPESLLAGILPFACAAHSQAEVSQPDYFGRWIEDQGQCDNDKTRDNLGYGTYEFAQGHRYHSEGVCVVKGASKHDKTWELDEECHSGAEQNYAITRMHWSLIVDGEKMTATVTHPGEKHGEPFTLTRCVK